MLESLQNWVHSLQLEPLLIVGVMVGVAFYLGKTMKFIRLPSIIGFMIIGVVLGPSVFDLLSEGFQEDLSFLTDLALGFVAVSIGLELSFSSLKKQGAGIITVIFSESLMAFGVVTAVVYFLTRDLPMALIFGAIAPASAPAGTVAIIQEYKAKGPLTRALYSVVGFDDGLGIIIFGFAAAFAKSFLGSEMGVESGSFLELIAPPLQEVGLSLLVGGGMALIYVFLGRFLKTSRDMFILLFALVLLGTGLSHHFHLSLILTNMVFGLVVVNTQKRSFVEKIHHELSEFMPLLFILFFVLAGANLHISALPSLGILGVVYIIGRTLGLMGGAKIGAHLGQQPESIKKYLGMGILSQAGVAIGLALIVKKEFVEFGAHGMDIGSTVITTVTATSLFFEIIGPILTKIGLSKAGELGQAGK
jgi:Kef-type K+ transport system membrane component KefB